MRENIISFRIEIIFFYNINTKYFKTYGIMMIMNISFTLMKNDEEYNKKRNPKYTHTHIYIYVQVLFVSRESRCSLNYIVFLDPFWIPFIIFVLSDNE